MQASLWFLPTAAIESIIIQMSRYILFWAIYSLHLNRQNSCHVMSACSMPCLPNQPVGDASYQRIPKRWGRKRARFSASGFLCSFAALKRPACFLLLIRRDISSFHLNLIWANRVNLQHLSGVCVCVCLCSCSLNWSCLSVSECCIDSLGTHLCPIMEQSSCAVTSVWRTARPYLLIPRLKTRQTSPAFLVCRMSAALTVLLPELEVISKYQWQRRFFAVLWYSQIWSCSRAVKGRHMEKWSVSVPQ